MEDEIKEKQDEGLVNPNQLTKEKAFNVVKQVCDTFKGSLQDHMLIQESLKLLR